MKRGMGHLKAQTMTYHYCIDEGMTNRDKRQGLRAVRVWDEKNKKVISGWEAVCNGLPPSKIRDYRWRAKNQKRLEKYLDKIFGGKHFRLRPGVFINYHISMLEYANSPINKGEKRGTFSIRYHGVFYKKGKARYYQHGRLMYSKVPLVKFEVEQAIKAHALTEFTRQDLKKRRGMFYDEDL